MLAPLVALALSGPASAATTVAIDDPSAPIRFALGHLEQALAGTGAGPVRAVAGTANPDIHLTIGDAAALGPEGYRVRRQAGALTISAGDEVGAMYALLDVAEQVGGRGSLAKVADAEVRRRFPVRAVKYNLPWSPYRPSYQNSDPAWVGGPAVTGHLETCRDLAYWQKFLDQMAENRLNTLSLWNFHPFTHMIRPTGFPKACALSDAELADWQRFWHALFAMASDRGVKIWLFNWNIYVSPAFVAAYGGSFANDRSEQVKTYTRDCVTQLIDEYPEIDGFGIAVGEGMRDMSSREREQWILDTVVAGLRAAKRPVTFIHRAPFEGSTAADFRWAMEQADLPGPKLAEIKFNWSHGHSTPYLQVTHSLKIDGMLADPEPTDFRALWTVRNEDIFILRWGDPDFVRSHIATNGGKLIDGYFIGSEGYIPAADQSHVPSDHKTWDYAFEKQWLFYTTWGRVLHDPAVKDERLVWAFARRYGAERAPDLLAAWRLASKVPLRIASFYAATWDYTLYTEGFAAFAASHGPYDGSSPLISVDELIGHATLDPAYRSITDHLARGADAPAGIITPPMLAAECDRDAQTLLALVGKQRAIAPAASGALLCELDDLATWAHLGTYFAEKLRGAEALARFRASGDTAQQQEAIKRLERAAEHWRALSTITAAHYHPTPHVAADRFSWSEYLPAVERDITTAREAKPTR
ncbi:MAG: hypothetical protein H0W72_04645 [Planctomycetes bacterium]|nr:hypothetical protein [Planctomycetota bacterium]